VALVVRNATREDAGDINALTNWYINHSAVNFDTQPWDLEKRKAWLNDFVTPYHCLVGTLDGVFAGYACNSRFRPKAAYSSSTETTVYVSRELQGQGIGRELYAALLHKVGGEDFHRTYAVITLPNPESMKMHNDLGFNLVGTFDEIGRKFGEYHSVAMLEKKL